MAFFVLGFAQGTIRRLIGIGSILFSFLFAANIAEPLGAYLGQNWTQFSTGVQPDDRVRDRLPGLGASPSRLVAQGFYKSQPLFEKARFVDELIGGVLGLVAGRLIFGAVLVILDTFFALPGIAADPHELPYLRDFWTALNGRTRSTLFRDTLIPAFFTVFGFLMPDWLGCTRLLARSTGRSWTGHRPTPPAHDPRRHARPDRRRPADARAGSSRSRRTSARRTWRRTPAPDRPTATRSCSDRPGIAYVYLVYGMHDCLNVVTGPADSAAALLIRAIEPIDGVGLMRADRLAWHAGRRRGAGPDAIAREAERLERLPDVRLASGPGLVAAAFGIDRAMDGHGPVRPDVVAPARGAVRGPDEPRAIAPRRGSASPTPGRHGPSVPWRFAIAGDPSVSGSLPGADPDGPALDRPPRVPARPGPPRGSRPRSRRRGGSLRRSSRPRTP